MRKLLTVATAAAMLSAPVHAADWRGSGMDAQVGAFAGARLRLALGAASSNRPQLALTIAPTRTVVGSTGRGTTRFGEGVAIDFAAHRPTLKLGGVPLDAALGFRRQADGDHDRKLGLSTTAWIGIGAVAVLATVLVVANLTCVGEDPDFCGSD